MKYAEQRAIKNKLNSYLQIQFSAFFNQINAIVERLDKTALLTQKNK